MADKPDSKRVLDLCDQALELQGAEREQFLENACGDNPGLRQSVDSVLIAIDSAGEFLDQSGDENTEVSFDRVGENIGGFTILRTLGEGGMGSVYLAERETEGFTQQVAIKLVHRHLLARELIERFNAERQILAALNHPYIAALIDGGTTSDGVPYIVMEYIRGTSIDVYCDQQRLSVAERIRLVQKIALAVQAAHQNLVVHRDLKPSNVIITDDGIPKLLDFGIAKLIEPDAASDGNTTLFGRQAMTPDFASPEQILENRVTTASDVYSLGVLTYELIAGARPYHIQTTSHRDLIRALEDLTIPGPSTRFDGMASEKTMDEVAVARATTREKLSKTLSGDLDLILLKALHREPARRYASIAEFSSDLSRYLGDHPVLARPDSLGYRAQRFVTRNAVGVGAVVAVVLALMAGLAGTSWAYIKAEQARADASNRFSQVRELASSLMFDVYEDVEQVPGTKTALQTIAGTAQQYLESLAVTGQAPLDVQLDAAKGYARLAAILSAPAVADPSVRETAADARAKARRLFDSLSSAIPESYELWIAKASYLTDNAQELLISANEPEAARAEVVLALAAVDNALQIQPLSIEALTASLNAQIAHADSFKWQNNYEESRKILSPALEDAKSLQSRAGEDESALKSVANAYRFSGELNWFTDDYEDGVINYQQAIGVYERIAAKYPEQQNPVLNQLVDTNWSLANTNIDLQRPQIAEPIYAKAIALHGLRVARDPGDFDAQRTLNILKGSRAAALARLDRGDEARQAILEVTDWFEGRAALDPDSPSAQRSLAVSYHMTANILEDAGQISDSCTYYQKTLDKWLSIDATLGLSDFDKDQPEKLREILNECGT